MPPQGVGSHLSARKKVQALNSWATTVLPYFFAAVRWPRSTVAQQDRKVRRVSDEAASVPSPQCSSGETVPAKKRGRQRAPELGAQVGARISVQCMLPVGDRGYPS